MSTAASEEDSMASKCLAFCQALVSQGQVFNFSLSIGSDFTFSLDTRSKASGSQRKKKPSPSTIRRNAKRRAEFMAKKQQTPPSRISNDEEAVQTSTVFPCDQCDYLGASEKGLKQHARMKHKKAEATPASPEALRSKEESSRSLIGSPLPLYNREENCRNCDGPFSPGHQCGDDKTEPDDGSDSEEGESDEDLEPPGDFDPPPVLTLLQTLSALSDDDQKRAVLALQLQLNSIIDNK